VLVGASLRRKEDGRLVSGGGRYIDDLVLPGMLHLGLVRSPHAHARVLAIDRDVASRLDGVLAVWTLEDLPELRASVPPLVPERWSRPYRHPVLAGDRVRHVGEAIAVVVAEDAYHVADAIERVRVEYERLPAAADPAAAAAPAAPRVHDEWPDNLAAVSGAGGGLGAAGVDEAELIVEARLAYPRVAECPSSREACSPRPTP
jgi:carbon-monoxide dehydrogenase large subunit